MRHLSWLKTKTCRNRPAIFSKRQCVLLAWGDRFVFWKKLPFFPEPEHFGDENYNLPCFRGWSLFTCEGMYKLSETWDVWNRTKLELVNSHLGSSQNHNPDESCPVSVQNHFLCERPGHFTTEDLVQSCLYVFAQDCKKPICSTFQS